MILTLKTKITGTDVLYPFEAQSLVEAQKTLAALKNQLAEEYRQVVRFSGTRTAVDRAESPYTGGAPTDGEWRIRDFRDKLITIFGKELRAEDIMYSSSVEES